MSRDSATIIFAAVRAIHLAACLMMLSVCAFDRLIVTGEIAEIWDTIARRLIWIALPAAIVSGAAWFVMVAVNMSGLPVAQAIQPTVLRLVLNGTQFGEVWKWRGVMWIGCALLMPRFSRRSWRIWPATILAALLLGSIAWAGHGETGRLPRWHPWLDAVHLLIASLWPGGLLPLAMLLWGTRFSVQPASIYSIVRRFSTMSLLAVGGLLLTGLFNSYCLLGSFGALFSATYGRVLLLKLALFLGMISLGAMNLLWLKPRLQSDDCAAAQMRFTVAMELILGTLILVIVGLLGILPPGFK